MLDSATIYLIAFILFVVLIRKPFLKGVTGSLDEHSQKVKDRIQEAKTLRQEAQELLASFEARQRESENETKQIVETAKKEAEILKQQAKEQAKKEQLQANKQLDNKLKTMEENATEQFRQLVISYSVAATQELLEQYTPESSSPVEQAKVALQRF